MRDAAVSTGSVSSLLQKGAIVESTQGPGEVIKVIGGEHVLGV